MQKIIKKPTNLLEINANFSPINEMQRNFNSFTHSMEELIKLTLKKNFLKKVSQDYFLELTERLPIIYYSNFNDSNFFSFVILCNADFTHGIGRFTGDMLSKCLIPGKKLAINGNRSLNFTFKNYKHNFYITEYFINFEEKDRLFIKKNIDHFVKQMRLIILAVFHARMVISMKTISEEEKSFLIKENIFSLLDLKEKESLQNAFDHMQNFLVNLSAEKNLSQIHENLNNLMNKYPNFYDRDIFESMHNVSLIFNDLFTVLREPKYISRLISYYYLFKKLIKQKVYNLPKERHIHFKFFKTQYVKNSSSAIGVLLTMNLLEEREHFDEAHFHEAIKSILPNITFVKSSFLQDKRDSKFLFFYVEIEKEHLENFTIEELKLFKKHFLFEVKERIEKSISSIFMPRNEEEIIRNIILLSKQLKYVKDIPQLIITYEKQMEAEISFQVILLRLIKEDSLPIKEYFAYCQTFLKFSADEVKIVGSLKKKYPKEANIFKVYIKKGAFYRKDFSLDLQKARQTVVSELAKVLGNFRDYNGGMILKQNQALEGLKNLLRNFDKDKTFLIENFFYSIKPGIMQTIVDTKILKTFFLLFAQILKKDFSEKKFYIKSLSMPKYLLFMIGSSSPSFKEKIESAIASLKIASFDLTSSFLEENGITTLGYIYRSSNSTKRSYFVNLLSNVMLKL